MSGLDRIEAREAREKALQEAERNANAQCAQVPMDKFYTGPSSVKIDQDYFTGAPEEFNFRESARALIREMREEAAMFTREADRLDSLLNYLPLTMSYDANRALAQLFDYVLDSTAQE